MTRVLVLYYSTYGHIETMAHAIAEGARGRNKKRLITDVRITGAFV